MTKSLLLCLLLSLVLPVRSLAATHVISQRQLTEGSLLGQVVSSEQLQHAFAAKEPLLARAGRGLGLSHRDFLAVRSAIESGHTRYVEVPRRLNGMAGEHGGVPFVLHDVLIPSNVYGWEVDLSRPDGLIRVFIPNQCGNISVLRVPKRYYVASAYHVPASAPVLPAAPRFAARAAHVAPSPRPQAIATTVPVAVAAPPASSGSPVPTAGAHHHLGWLPFLLVPVIFAFAGHGGTSAAPSIAPTPIPIHTICPGSIR
jgi:hypothetical protein